MIRISAVFLMTFMLAGCGNGNDAGAPLQGKWGWFTPDACIGDRDVIEFAQSEFRHWGIRESGDGEPAPERGEVLRQGRDTEYRENEEGWITATYVIDRQGAEPLAVSLTFEPSAIDLQGGAGEAAATREVLLFRGSVIDGVAPEAAATYMGQPLFACEGSAAAS